MKYFETTNFQKNTERQFVPKNLWNKLWGFFGSKFIRSFTILFTDLSHTHVHFYREKKKVYKRTRESSATMES